MRAGLVFLAPALALAAIMAVPAALADADPASDVLYVQDVYLPYNNLVPTDLATKLTESIGDAKKAGYKIKVAIIASRDDLGLIQGLWLKPRRYAPFLGRELVFLYRENLLVVMPNGFGVYRYKADVSREKRIVGSIPIPAGGAGLGQAALTAVRRLSAAAGHPLKTGGGGSQLLDRFLIAGAAIVLLIVLVVGTRTRRRRQREVARGTTQ
jgi:hypothetical protein